MILKVTALVLLSLVATANCGYFQTGGFMYPQRPLYQTQYPFTHYYPQYQQHQFSQNFQIYKPHPISHFSNQYNSVSRPVFIPISQVLSNQIHQVSSTTFPSNNNPQQPSNILAIHSANPPRKNVLSQEASPNYKFNYAVNNAFSGVRNSHQETRTGDEVVGKYTVVDPDGNLREVSYTVSGNSGFKAVVKNTPGFATPNYPPKKNLSQFPNLYI